VQSWQRGKAEKVKPVLPVVHDAFFSFTLLQIFKPATTAKFEMDLIVYQWRNTFTPNQSQIN
jgi:hypothetical protein